MYAATTTLFAAAMHSHERYIVTLFVFCIYIIFTNSIQLRKKYYLLSYSIFWVIFNFAMKTAVLHIPFFMGTGGQKVGIDINQIIVNFKHAVTSIFWFNSGPEYLSGLPTAALPLEYILIAATCAALTIAIFLYGFFGAISAKENFMPPILLLMISIALLVPGLLQFRLEQRWLLASFCFLLLFLAWAARYAQSQSLISFLAVALMSASLILENRLIFSAERRFFLTDSARYAEDALSLIDGRTTPIVLDGLAPSLCQWVLADGLFFRMYQGQKREIYCIGPSWAPPSPPPDTAEHVVYSQGGFHNKSN
ncbi:hypothetical protein [Xanthobacter sediminis]|uniref:hypothetical protein n=1 Tax=Xanthobacter sediminis TaxID=3119926 RepID=UPI0037264429